MQPSDGTPDPAALAVAKAAQSAVHHSAIILFGSRAAGTHWADSDVALMLVCSKSPIAEQSRAQRAARAHLQGNSPPLRVDIVPMELGDFNYCGRAKNHVASQAYCKGIIMGGGRLDFSSNDEDEYPASWPDVQWRIQAAYRNLGGFRREFEHPEREQEDYCFHAQKAVGNSLKAWVSAAELEYSGVHDLASIAQSVLKHLAESYTLAAQPLRMLLDYATAPDLDDPKPTVNWLSFYGAWYRYHGTSHQMTDDERERFREEGPTSLPHIHQPRPRAYRGQRRRPCPGDLARATLPGRPCPGDLARATLPDRNPNAQQRETPRE